MWVVKSCPAGWWCADNPNQELGTGVRVWPPRLDVVATEGDAVTLCDVLNARDYPDVES